MGREAALDPAAVHVGVRKHLFIQLLIFIIRVGSASRSAREAGHRHTRVADVGADAAGGGQHAGAMRREGGVDDHRPTMHEDYTIQARVRDQGHGLCRQAAQNVQQPTWPPGEAVGLGQPARHQRGGDVHKVAGLARLVLVKHVVFEVRHPERAEHGRVQAHQPRASGRTDERHDGVDGRDLGGPCAP